MRLFTTIFERLPMVWLLLGLLFIATGLYLGFDYTLSFGYMIVGCFCSAYGLALFTLRRMERPKSTAATRLSRDFISVGAPVIMPAVPSAEKEQAPERPDAA